jgi:hypothetical protein
MSPTYLVIAFIAVPALLLTLLRVNATLVFLSLCLGQVLVQFVGNEAASTVGIIASDGSTNQALVSLGLIVTPAIFTTLFMIRTIKGKLRLALNILPALAVGVLGLLLIEPLLAPGIRSSLEASSAWNLVQGLQTLVVGVSAIVSMFFLWLQRPKSHGGGHGDVKKHK